MKKEIEEFIRKYEFWRFETRDRNGERIGGFDAKQEEFMRIVEKLDEEGWSIRIGEIHPILGKGIIAEVFWDGNERRLKALPLR